MMIEIKANLKIFKKINIKIKMKYKILIRL